MDEQGTLRQRVFFQDLSQASSSGDQQLIVIQPLPSGGAFLSSSMSYVILHSLLFWRIVLNVVPGKGDFPEMLISKTDSYIR